jgi:hypothetical protein
MGAIGGILLFFGLGLAALLILLLSARFARSVLAVVSWGLIAIVLMVLECMLLTYLAGIGSATSGSQAGYRIVTIAFALFAISVPLYFAFALGRVRKKKRSSR